MYVHTQWQMCEIRHKATNIQTSTKPLVHGAVDIAIALGTEGPGSNPVGV
jgi:hypothetical protein